MHKTRNSHRSEYDLYGDLEKIKDALAACSSDVKGKAGEMISQTIEDFKEKSSAAQENFSTYVTERPFKSIGLTFLTGMIIGYFLRK